MRLNAIQTLIILLAITVGTVITRFLPPILFPHGKPLPKFLQELCTLLPPAMMGLLLVYSLRNVSFASAGQWLPECIAIAVTAGLHLWRRNSLLSIAGGTIIYMLLVNAPFMLRDEPTGGAGSGVGVRCVPPLQSHLRRTHLCLNQSPSGLLPLLRRDSGVRCIVQRGSHRQLLAEEAVCPAVARSGAA